MPVKRVVVINDMTVTRGGATALAVLSAELLRASGLAVTFITGDAGDAPDLAAKGVEIIAANGQELLQMGAAQAAVKGIHNPVGKALIADFIQNRDTPETVYHVHGWGQILSPSIFQPLQKVAARTVVHCHDFFLACPNGVFFDFQKEQDCTRKPLGLACALTHCDKRSYVQKGWRLARHGWFRHVFSQSAPWAAIILIHPMMKPQMVQADYPPDRIVTVRNPALPFSPSRIKAEANQGFVFVGRVEPDKGIRELISAVRLAKVPLMVIGDGPLRQDLARDNPQVVFPGWKSRSEIGVLIQNARALVMPSRFREPFGLVAVEASQSGLPVILPRSALLADEITQGGLGFSCDIRDAQGFAALLRQVNDAPAAEIKAISQAGFAADVPLGQNPDDWIAALIALYDQAIAKAAA